MAGQQNDDSIDDFGSIRSSAMRQLWQGLGAYAWRVGVRGGNTTTGAS